MGSQDPKVTKNVCGSEFSVRKTADPDPDIPILKQAKAEYARRVLSSTSSGRVKVPQAPK
jgi:hypothetical protein